MGRDTKRTRTPLTTTHEFQFLFLLLQLFHLLFQFLKLFEGLVVFCFFGWWYGVCKASKCAGRTGIPRAAAGGFDAEFPPQIGKALTVRTVAQQSGPNFKGVDFIIDDFVWKVGPRN